MPILTSVEPWTIIARGFARVRLDLSASLIALVPDDGSLYRDTRDRVAQSVVDMLSPGVHRVTVFADGSIAWTPTVKMTSTAVVGRYVLADDGIFRLVELGESLGESSSRPLRMVQQNGGAVTVTSLESHRASPRDLAEAASIKEWLRAHGLRQRARAEFEAAVPGMELLWLMTTCGLTLLETEWDRPRPYEEEQRVD